MLLTKKDINTSLAEALAASSNAVERKIQQLQSQLELAYQKSANDSNTIQNLQEQLKATKIDYSTTIKVLEAQRKAS
jgi:biotin operon repressor